MPGPLFKEDFMIIVNADKTDTKLVGHNDMDADRNERRNTEFSGLC